MHINGDTYRAVCKELGKQYGKPMPAVAKTYSPKFFRFDRQTNTGTCNVTGTTRFGLPKQFTFQVGDDGAITFGEPRPAFEWPKHWKKRIAAVQQCKNLDLLESLLEVETSENVMRAITEQIEDQL